VRHQIFNQPVPHPEKEGGYGLILTRQMVSDMGGSVRLLPDHPNQGAVFLIKLPAQPAAHDLSQVAPAGPTAGRDEQEEGDDLT
jgi:sensor histidine kinase regulating citrate/malate metabolism